jgi:hypothetical protein
MTEQEIDLSLDMADLGLSVRASAQLKKVNEILSKIEKQNALLKEVGESQIDITENWGIPYEKIGWSLTYFGEHGREPFMRACKFAEGFDAQKVSEKFTEHLGKKRKPDSPAGFYKWCKEAGINTNTEKKKKEGVKGGNERTEMVDSLPYEADQEDFIKFGLWEQDGHYWSLTEKGYSREITNFTMSILFHIGHSISAAYKIIHIKNDHGIERVIFMNTDDFVTVGTFRKSLIRYGRFLFKGNDTDLLKLHDKLLREEKHARQIRNLGFDKDSNMFFFSNGLITTEGEFVPTDSNGIINYDGKYYFIECQNKTLQDFQDDYENEKRFVYQYSANSFSDWASQYCKVFGKQGWVAIAFWYATINSDFIFNHLKRFPLLFLYGQRGTGKGALIESLMKLFGKGQPQIMLGGESSVKSFMRTLAQKTNSFVWLDEYKNNINKNAIESLKNIYDRIGYSRANKDMTNRTTTMPINSVAIVSGQEMPTIEPAFYSRNIILTMIEKDLTDEDRKTYDKLKSMENDGISHLSGIAFSYRKRFIELFEEYFNEQRGWLVKSIKGEGEVIERLILNYSTIITSAKIMCELFTLPFNFKEFQEYSLELFRSQFQIMSTTTDGNKFWEILEQLFNQTLIVEGKDFEIYEGQLILRLNSVYGFYVKELRLRNDPNILQKSTLENYLMSDKKSFIQKAKKQFEDGSYTHSLIFKYNTLGINLIRRAGKEDTWEKMKEMGVDVPDNKQHQKAQAQQAALMMDQAMDEADKLDY